MDRHIHSCGETREEGGVRGVRGRRRGRVAVVFDFRSLPSQTVQEIAFQGNQKLKKDDPPIDYQTFR